MDFDKLQDELETFYKVKGKYSNSADLIRSVISKTLKVVKEKIKVSHHQTELQGANSGQLQQHNVMAALPLCSCGGGDNDGHAWNCPWQENQDGNEP